MYRLWYGVYLLGYWLQRGTDRIARRICRVGIAIAAFGIRRARNYPQWYADEQEG